MNPSQYITPPPNLPFFLFKRSSVLKQMIEWAKHEHNLRLRWCAEHGYWKEFKRLNEEYSPIRVLAEVGYLKKVCSVITQRQWNELTARERVFIRRAYEMRLLLYRN